MPAKLKNGARMPTKPLAFFIKANIAMAKLVQFDESLTLFVQALSGFFDPIALANGWILRDAAGHLVFISTQALTDAQRKAASQPVADTIQHYAREFGCVLDIEQPGINELLSSAQVLREPIELKNGESIQIKLIDRRLVGIDWLATPTVGWEPPAPARFVFASLKGGVGRTTALAVTATALAQKGYKVLALDLDLEVPGLGTLLLSETEKPRFGILDWYVEQVIGNTKTEDREFLLDILAPSSFGRGHGLIDVAPAIGQRSDIYPANVLAKLARAYMEIPQEHGSAHTFLMQTQKLITLLGSLKHYDVILIDARAGLNESTAAALLGLGADILLFGVDTPQTFAGYRYLLAHLARLTGDPVESAWLYRLRMVHAKAPRDSSRQAAFRDQAYAVFAEFLYQNQPMLDDSGQPLLESNSGAAITIEQFGLDDTEAPHFAWPILSDANYAEFDPLAHPNQLLPESYQQTYMGLLEGILALLSNSEVNR